MTPFQANVPVVLDGVGVFPGQYVFADSSGAVVIPAGQVDEVLAEARRIEASDAASRDQIAREQPPEVELSRIGSELPGINGKWRGLEEFGSAMESYIDALADLHLEAERIIDLGKDGVLVLVRQTAKGKTSGLPFHHEFGDLFTLRDGKILSYASYWDRAEAVAAAGVKGESAGHGAGSVR